MDGVLPVMAPADAPVVAALSRASGAVLGRPPVHAVASGPRDQKHIEPIGRLHNCVACGPGMLDLAHQPDEYVVVDDMVDAAAVMAVCLADLLGRGGN